MHRSVEGFMSGLRQAAGVRVGAVRDRGSATAEYAIVTVAACAFAGMLVLILRGAPMKSLLFGLIRGALNAG